MKSLKARIGRNLEAINRSGINALMNVEKAKADNATGRDKRVMLCWLSDLKECLRWSLQLAEETERWIRDEVKPKRSKR